MLNNFRRLGLKVWIDDSDDKINVSGLKSINKDKAAEIRNCIQQHRQEIIDELKSEPKYDIEPMSRCLHQEPCVYLMSKRGCRPWCAVAGEAIFDMRVCPRALWGEALPVVMPHAATEHREIRAENCPARCRRTGKCYHEAAFHGKAGRGIVCQPESCKYIYGFKGSNQPDDNVP